MCSFVDTFISLHVSMLSLFNIIIVTCTHSIIYNKCHNITYTTIRPITLQVVHIYKVHASGLTNSEWDVL